MTLSRNNWFARYYLITNDYLPDDLCSFFWGTFFSVMLAPFTLVGGISARLTDWSRSTHKCFWYGILTYLFYAILVLTGASLYSSWFLGLDKITEEFWGLVTNLQIYLWFPLLALVVVTLGFGAFAAVVVSIIYISERDVRLPEIKVFRNTRDLVGAIKGKYCTPIKWK